MTASEKLRVLQSFTNPNYGPTPIWVATAVLGSLPQLAAVAAAAEWVSESGVLSFERHKALSDALTALEEELA